MQVYRPSSRACCGKKNGSSELHIDYVQQTCHCCCLQKADDSKHDSSYKLPVLCIYHIAVNSTMYCLLLNTVIHTGNGVWWRFGVAVMRWS